jgi:hypothetical protein
MHAHAPAAADRPVDAVLKALSEQQQQRRQQREVAQQSHHHGNAARNADGLDQVSVDE